MEATAATDLLNALRAKQAAAGLNDSAFARRLGVSKTMWSLVQNGKAEPSLKLVRGVLRAFPDLSPYVTLFLSAERRIVNTR